MTYAHTYCPAAVQREIDKERQRKRISKREARNIHRLLKGWRNAD